MHRLPPPSEGTWMVVALAQGEPMEIADLVGSRHDTVMASIERLAVRGVIDVPAMTENPYTQGRPGNVYVFEGEQGKISLPPMVGLPTPSGQISNL